MQDNSITKGAQIKLTGGKYVGKMGWINVARGKQGFTEQQVHIIVDQPRVYTRVKQGNITTRVSSDGKPLSFEEAILDEKPFINKLMHKLARELAKANVGKSSMKTFGDLLATRVAYELTLMKNNPKATFYHIKSNPEEGFSKKRGSPARDGTPHDVVMMEKRQQHH